MMQHSNSLRHEVRVFKHGFKNEQLNTLCLEIKKSFKSETNFKLYLFFREYKKRFGFKKSNKNCFKNKDF